MPGLIEHAVAYAGTAALLTLGYHGRIRPLLIASPLVLYAAMLECGQIFVPGRSADVLDFAASSAGAFVGVLTGLLALRALAHRLTRSYFQ